MGSTIQRQTLEEKTFLFWSVSKAYNLQEGPLKGINTEKAITCLGELEDSMSRQRNLAQRTTKLLDEVIGIPWCSGSDNYNFWA